MRNRNSGVRSSTIMLPVRNRESQPWHLAVCRKVLHLFMAWLLIGHALCASADVHTALRKGQSLTLLPNGQILLAGGYGKRQLPTGDLLVMDTSGNVTTLPTKMNYARAGHTATVLPDGRVLIFGGYGVNGELVPIGELLDPISKTATPISEFRLLPRAFYTATVLTDGTLVVIGGVGAGGELVPDVQVWDYRTGKTLAYNAGLSVPRQQHLATLLANGNVQISNGLDRFGRQAEVTEEYDPVARKFSINSSSTSSDTPTVEDSIPVDGASDVRITDILAVRFGSRMSVTSLNSTNVTLQDSTGNSVQATVTGAEAGRLLFVVPSSPLQFGMFYLLTLDSVLDSSGSQLPTKTIQFTTQSDPQDSSDEEWVPGPGDFNGQWHSHTGPSEWQKLPALQAKVGTTALSGQVLRLNGRPLQHVLLQVDGQHAFSDRTGRFLVPNIHGGHHVLVIDGTTANRAGVTYGLFEVGLDIAAGKTNALNYTIWMTKLDLEHAVNIPSPTMAQDTVITTPRLPGLELHLPQNTVIVDHNGHPVHQLTITAVPLDKPPFPLPPGVAVPIYFTIQPGGAYIDVRGYSSTGPKGARLIYPNPYHSPAGTAFNFWNYDADSKGWYIYGQGKVAPDAKSVAPDPGVVVYEFTGAMVGSAGGPVPFKPNNQKCKDPCDNGGDGGVDLTTGNYEYSDNDLGLPDIGPITLDRTYRSNDGVSRAFGIGGSMPYDMYISGADLSGFGYTPSIDLIGPDGSRVHFPGAALGPGFSGTYANTSDQTSWYGAVLSGSVSSRCKLPGEWQLETKDGTVYSFPESFGSTDPKIAALVGITDRYCNTISLQRDSQGNLLQITSPNGRYVQLTYDASNRIIQATDSIGRSTSYNYDSTGRLATATDANGGQKSYTYDNNNNLLTITDARGTVIVSNQYDGAGRVVQQTLANGGTYLYSWTPTQNTSQVYQFNDPNGASAGGTVSFRNCSTCNEGYTPVISQGDVTDPRGYVHRVIFDSMGRKSTEIFALGQTEQQVYSYQYFADNALSTATDVFGHQTKYLYDANLNTVRVDELAETNTPVTSLFTYDPAFNQLASATDPLGHTTTFSVDANGNATQILDALGNGIPSVAYNADGTVALASDSAGNTVQFGYTAGDLTSTLDPMGNQTVQFVDGAGRVIGVTDAAGNQTRYQYDNSDRLTALTDSSGNLTSLTHDANGNLITVTDPLGHSTTFGYNGMNEVATRTDSLQRQETYAYDLNGNITSLTDRRGQLTNYAYDGRNRITQVGSGAISSGGSATYTSTVTYQYDAAGRLTQAMDSLAGTISRSYDVLDNLMSEVTPMGSITYGYDAIGRRTTMQAPGQPQTVYSYDIADRLTQMSHGSSIIAFGYDNIGRRSTLTLPNGIIAAYSYDGNSNVTNVTYTLNSNVLGDLSYSYDKLGRRVVAGGSLAGVVIPASLTSANYDAANELINWNGSAQSYDANGNLINDGAHTYGWDARNHLVNIDAGSTASFNYDPFGRRVTKAISGVATNFVYDGANPVQEISGGSVTQLIAGGIDEYFSRIDPTGQAIFETDLSGSTTGLSDSNGTLVTQYRYEPYGATSLSGVATGNEFAYSGRESDATGLYFYRARYYDPIKGRFISEDPLGQSGGNNLYPYAGDDPINRIDPLGLRDIYVAIWNRDLVDRQQVGHAMALELNGTAILSQFPDCGECHKGKNQTKTWRDSRNSEGRDPSRVFKVHVPNDAAFDAEARNQRQRPFWDWLPTTKNQTNCVFSVSRALRAGGVPVGSPDWPGDLGDELKDLEKVRQSHIWSVTDASTNDLPTP